MAAMNCENLECKLLYLILCAGAQAKRIDNVMPRLADALKSVAPTERLWFPAVRRAIALGKLADCLSRANTGKYAARQRSFEDAASCGIDLTTCTLDDLERIYGVGCKTSRNFLNWTGRPGRFVPLDTHILKWLSRQGHVVPSATPPKGSYHAYEEMFLAEADKRHAAL